MIALDTNVLLRFVTADHDAQYQLAKNLISNYYGKNKSIYINTIVLCEFVWVLKSGYKYSRQQITELLHMLVRIEEFEFSERDEIFEAIVLYQNGGVDFADYLIHVINKKKGCLSTYSFDQQAINDGLFATLQ